MPRRAPVVIRLAPRPNASGRIGEAQKPILIVRDRRDFLQFIYILCTARLPIQDVVAFPTYQLGTHGDGM